MSNSISYGLCARACTYLSLYIHGDCIAATFIFLQEAPFQRISGFSWLVVDDRDDHQDGGGGHLGHSDHQTKSTRYKFSLIKSDISRHFISSGTKTANFSQWVEEPFDEMDSTLAVQQYIQQTIRR